MAITKQINQLNNAGEIQSSDYVALAQSGQSEATKATISDLAAAVGELNSTGALAELELATSLGKNLLAQRLTEKGQTCSPSDTLISMADKIDNLDVAEGTDYLKVLPITQNMFQNQLNYSYCCRIPGTNFHIALDTYATTVYLLDTLNNLELLDSISTGFTTSLGSTVLGAVFTFACDGSHVIIKCNAEVVSVKVNSDKTLSIEGVVTTLVNQYNCPMITNKEGTKLLTTGHTSGSGSNATLILYNLEDGTNTTCTNVNSISFYPAGSSTGSAIGYVAYIYTSNDNTTVYSIGSISQNSTTDTLNAGLYISTIDWTTPSFTYGVDTKAISFNGRETSNTNAVYINTSKNKLYRMSTQYVSTYSATVTPYIKYMTVLDMTTGETKTINFYRLRYTYQTLSGSDNLYASVMFIKHLQDKDIIYTDGAKFEFDFNNDELTITSKNVKLDNIYLSGMQYFYVNTGLQGSHAVDTYIDGNYVKCASTSAGGEFYSINASYNRKTVSAGSNTLQTDITQIDNPDAKQYVIGTVYRRNGNWVFFQYPYGILSNSILYGGAMDVETNITYLPEDSDESI